MNTEQKNDYRDKLRRFLATPHSSNTFFEEYKEENKDANFDDYTKSLEDLIDKLDEGKLDDQAQFCEEIKKLKLPHNQFGC
ncbi:hypothetical protein PZB74_19060 [Porifericola rhodea]|uniref:hypothetical protein n=1 Tax=Porifericola rhodea TaxID=930972 RepID=UPI0026666A18|nr:hypothetical protein [Porifericola rhodea]WKN31053.1 hypothetical protein PZB74_19060 [Porifericola rhodea]